MKGPELVKKLYDGEVKDNSDIYVHRCTPLGNVELIIKYKDKGLIWNPRTFDTSYLFDNNIEFYIEDGEIEELDTISNKYVAYSIEEIHNKFNEITNKINEIIRKVNEDGKK